MNRFTFAAALLSLPAALTATAAMADMAASAPQWPADAQEKNDPRVLAFYDGTCAQYADRQGLVGEAHDAFVTRCRGSIPRVFPVGYEEGDSGGEE